MTKWEYINKKRSHSHLSYSHSRPIPISLSNLVLIWCSFGAHGNPMVGMGIPHFPFLCTSLSEPVLLEIVLNQYLPILMYGVKCFSLLVEQTRKLCIAFNSVIRCIFKLSRYTSLCEVIVYIGSKPRDILLDERRFLLLLFCLKSICNPIRLGACLMKDSADVRCIKMKHNVDFIVSASAMRKQFFFTLSVTVQDCLALLLFIYFIFIDFIDLFTCMYF